MKTSNAVARYLYLFTLFFLVLTGFAQMPIFKRYYIADIPGLGWLAKFFITHYMHYLFATLFIALTAYFILDYVFVIKKTMRLTVSGYIRSGVLLGLTATGILLVIRNLSEVYLSPSLIIILDVVHLALCVLMLIIGPYMVVTKKRWVKKIG